MELLEHFLIFASLLCICNAVPFTPFMRNIRQLDCPPSDAIIEARDAQAPVIAVPPVFYLDEAQKVWVSLGPSDTASLSQQIILQIYFATIGGHIAGTECYSSNISDESDFSQTTDVEIVFPKSAFPVAATEDIFLVTRWCHGSSRCEGWRESRKRVQIMPESTIVLIQTNKAVFNPEQTVEITLFTINRNLIPISTDMEIDILGPNDVIHQRLQIPKNIGEYKGVFRTNFQFPPLALHGLWTIRTKYGLDMSLHEEVLITLRNYRLPTFLVAIEMDEVTVLNSEWHLDPIQTQISARHVFGSVVHGSVNCSASYVKSKTAHELAGWTAGIEYMRWDNIDLPMEGSLILDIPLHFLKHSLRTKLDVLTLYFQCNVTECLSGVTESKTVKLVLRENMYSINFDASQNQFKPSLPYLFQASILDATGKGASNVSCAISAMNCDTSEIYSTYTVTSNWKGRIATVLRDIESPPELCIEVNVVETDISDVHRVLSSENDVGEFISMVSEESNLDHPLEFEVHATHPYQIQSLYALTYARGTIVEQRKENFEFFRNPHNLRFHNIDTLAPKVEILVFYVAEDENHNSVIVADKLAIELERRCSEMETVETDKLTYGTGEMLTMTYKGYPDTTAVSQAIDIAALSLGTNGVITQEKFQEVLHKHSQAAQTNHTAVEGTLSGPLVTPVPSEGESQHSQDIVAEIADCCEWGRIQDWNPETSPCDEFANKLLLAEKYTPECITEVLECCKSEHGESGQDYYNYDYGILIDDDPLSEALVDQALRGKEVFRPFKRRSSDQTSTEQDLRYNFQETIAFPLQSIRFREASFETQLPDSLTSWEIQSVFLNQHIGMCVPPPTTIQVRKDIFVRVSLPDRVVLGEFFEISAVIYNDMDAWFNGYINLEDVSAGLCHGRDDESEKYAPSIPPHETRAVHWAVIPDALGDHNFTVKLSNQSGTADAVRMAVHVNHMGFELTKAHDRTILRPAINNTLFLAIPFAAGENTLTAVIQLDANIFKPNLESTAGMDKSLLYSNAESILVHLTSLLYTYRYMDSHGSFQLSDKRMVHNEVELATVNLLQYLSPTLDCFTMFHYDTNTHVCDERLTKFAGIVLLEAVTSELLTQYVDVACTAVLHTFYNMFHTECEKAHLYTLLNGSNCSPDSYIPTDGNAMSVMIEKYATNSTLMDLCHTPDIHLMLLMRRKEVEHFQALAQLLDQWSTPFEGDEQYQSIALKMTEVSGEDIEDAAWLLWTATHRGDVAVATALASWMLQHRDAYGAFVTYSDTIIALQALHEYTLKSLEPSVENNAVCRAYMENGARSDLIGEVHLSDPGVTQNIDVTSALDKSITVQCSTGLVYMQTLINYHTEAGRTPCPLNVTATVSIPRRGRGRGARGRSRAKRAADCEYDPEDEIHNRHSFVVSICIDGLLELQQKNHTSSLGEADITVSLFSGYRPQAAYLKQNIQHIQTWEYIPGKRSVLFKVNVPPGETSFCTNFLKSALTRVDNIQPGLVTVASADGSLQCSTLYHTDDSHPLLDRPSTCGRK